MNALYSNQKDGRHKMKNETLKAAQIKKAIGLFYGLNRFMRRIPHPRLQGGVSRLAVVCIASILPEGLRQPIKHNMPDATKPVSNNTSRDRWQTLCESPAN